MGNFKDSLLLPKTTVPIKSELTTKEVAKYKEWDSEKVYNRMKRDGNNPFILHDGPPYANGDIHIGHALNKILKDFVVKMQYFSGRSVDFIPGWDCHGLPIEQKVQATIKLNEGAKDTFNESEVFIKMCRKYASKQVEIQKEQFKTLGVIADWENPYRTMDKEFETMIFTSLCELATRNLLVQRRKPVYWDWAGVIAFYVIILLCFIGFSHMIRQ